MAVVSRIREDLTELAPLQSAINHYVLQVLYESAVFGILISLVTLFPIVLVSTMNVVLSVLATLTVFMVVTAVLGVLSLSGGQLGVRSCK